MRRHQGFTLIELMIVVAIIAILAMVAYPSYQDSVRQTRRSGGQSALLQAVQNAERYFTENNTYVGYVVSPAASDGGFYNLTHAVAATASTFTISATPIGDQTNDDCGTMTINNTNVRTPAGCW